MPGTGWLDGDVTWMQMADYVKGAFTGRAAEKVLLQPGLERCKLSGFRSLTRPGSGEGSP